MVKKLIRIFVIVLLFLPLIAAAHFIAFPQETRCILIGLANFKKKQNIYYRDDVPENTIQHFIELKSSAEKKVCMFWKDAADVNYKLIYCEAESDYNNYGRKGSPAVSNLKMGAYVVVPKDMFDVNILSHEISHTVLYRKIGWYNLHFKIPAWFEEGLAMQVDDRDYYSIDTLMKKRSEGSILPGITKMDTPEKFYGGSLEEAMLNYSTAKYVVHEWLKKHSIDIFIKSINSGYSFERSYYMNN